MQNILRVIRQFQRNVFPAHQSKFEELASGQQPPTLLITCSDSRIVPEMVTQTEPGELFVIRSAGNLVPPHDAPPSGEAATIEYAVKVLKVQEIVVCGHSHCGAVNALLQPESLRDLPNVRDWLRYGEVTLHEVEQLAKSAGAPRDLLTAAIECNVRVQLDNLRTYPFIADAEADGKLGLHGWFYRFETGQIFELDAAAQKFVDIADFVDDEPLVV